MLLIWICWCVNVSFLGLSTPTYVGMLEASTLGTLTLVLCVITKQHQEKFEALWMISPPSMAANKPTCTDLSSLQWCYNGVSIIIVFSFGKEGIVVSWTRDFAIIYVVHDLEFLLSRYHCHVLSFMEYVNEYDHFSFIFTDNSWWYFKYENYTLYFIQCGLPIGVTQF